jgi:hypothetical protein
VSIEECVHTITPQDRRPGLGSSKTAERQAEPLTAGNRRLKVDLRFRQSLTSVAPRRPFQRFESRIFNVLQIIMVLFVVVANSWGSVGETFVAQGFLSCIFNALLELFARFSAFLAGSGLAD